MSIILFCIQPMDGVEKSPNVRPRTAKTGVILPETEIYIHLLVLIFLLDRNKHDSVS